MNTPRHLLHLVLCIAALAPSAVRAQVSDELAQRIKTTIEANTQGSVVVDSIRSTPVDGLYEVATKGMDLFYVDKTGRYSLVDGRLVDMRDKKDLTLARLDQLRSIDFKALPLNLAIKRGTGRKVMAVFEDPTCPACIQLHKFIAQIPDTTVYAFPFPVVTKEALPISATAWCAPNRADVWERAMKGGGVAGATRPACDISGLQAIVRLGETLRIHGTPTVFLANGRRIQGAVPPDEFIAALEESARPTK